jgi:hypothetical protein
MATNATFDHDTTAQEVVDAFGDEIKGKTGACLATPLHSFTPTHPPSRLTPALLTAVVVTGPSPGGIGAETARAIATKAPKLLILAGRDTKK